MRDPVRDGEEPRAVEDLDWEADRRRYPKHPWFRDPSIWAVWLYRFGRRCERRRRGPIRVIANGFYKLAQLPVELLTGISIPRSVRIGPGLRIYHFGNVVIHKKAVIGAHCTLRHGVTIGNRYHGGGVPTLEDNVELGAYAQVLGDIRIGQGARIGALSLVLEDVPRGRTAVGVPARIVEGKTKGTEFRIDVAAGREPFEIETTDEGHLADEAT